MLTRERVYFLGTLNGIVNIKIVVCVTAVAVRPVSRAIENQSYKIYARLRNLRLPIQELGMTTADD